MTPEEKQAVEDIFGAPGRIMKEIVAEFELKFPGNPLYRETLIIAILNDVIDVLPKVPSSLALIRAIGDYAELSPAGGKS